MALKYSGDEITDEEINLQTTAQQCMMQSDAQQKTTTPLPFQKDLSPPR